MTETNTTAREDATSARWWFIRGIAVITIIGFIVGISFGIYNLVQALSDTKSTNPNKIKSKDTTCVTVNGVQRCYDTPADAADALPSPPKNGKISRERIQISTGPYSKGTDSKRIKMSYKLSSSGSTGY